MNDNFGVQGKNHWRAAFCDDRYLLNLGDVYPRRAVGEGAMNYAEWKERQRVSEGLSDTNGFFFR